MESELTRLKATVRRKDLRIERLAAQNVLLMDALREHHEGKGVIHCRFGVCFHHRNTLVEMGL